VSGQIPELRRQVTDAVAPIIARLEPSDIITEGDARIIGEAAQRAGQVAQEFFSRINEQSVGRLGRLAIAEIDYERRLFQRSMPVEWNFRAPSDNFARNLMRYEPIDGRTLSEWFKRLSSATATQINTELREGMLAGEDINTLLRRVRGRRENRFADGIIARSGRQAEMIVRSGVMKASNRARQEFHKQNSDVISGYSVILTLDDRTCVICVDKEAQNPWPVDSPPDPPFHVGCRCVEVAVTKSWRELGIDLDEMEPGTRKAVMDGMVGDVPDTMDYQEWFERQPTSLQKEILGPGRYEAFKKGMDVTAFADDGRILTIDQLAAMEPDLFN